MGEWPFAGVEGATLAAVRSERPLVVDSMVLGGEREVICVLVVFTDDAEGEGVFLRVTAVLSLWSLCDLSKEVNRCLR